MWFTATFRDGEGYWTYPVHFEANSFEEATEKALKYQNTPRYNGSGFPDPAPVLVSIKEAN